VLARRITIALCALGAAGALGFLVFALATGDDPRGLGGVTRGLWLLAHARWRATALGLTAIVAIACAALAWLARRGRAALLAIAIAGPVAIALAWAARTIVARMEDPRFRAKSPYVHGATAVAIALSAYLAALTAAAIVAYVQARRPAAPPPAA
jgi:hypothetical protein